MTKTEEAKYLHTVERHLFQDELRRLKTRQGRFEAEFYHLGSPLPGATKPLEASDQGKGAESIYAAIEVIPLWQKLWIIARNELKPKRRAVLDALLVDMRPQVAAKICGYPKSLVYRCLNEHFPKAFATCYRAYKRASSSR